MRAFIPSDRQAAAFSWAAFLLVMMRAGWGIRRRESCTVVLILWRVGECSCLGFI